MKRILSYNVNGIRAAIKRGFQDWLVNEAPDIICLQETKAQPGQMEEETFQSLGYQIYAHSAVKKGYSGVAILCKEKPDHVEYGMNNPKYDVEGRVIRADFGDLSVLSAYFPSGTTGGPRQDYKMDFLADFQAYLNELRKERPNLVVSGDYNICRLWIDIHNPEKQQNTSGFLPEEREWFQQFVDDGYCDSFREIVSEPDQYSWWSYRAGSRARNKGWRIDYHMVTEPLKSKVKGAGILADVVHSDHCPVWVELDA
ncbi:exodeoxyribonuclease III [uncultured Sunxiuqinia sp.]|uniref:exodeoxyribonuclease III n=1 Tax=uncultured Sunxiuqinia sp. TaxID=1573825 RepID=UPI0026376689|nr:exodeoxyribonuclease III [uncultured Sunxiuqinia sp.]